MADGRVEAHCRLVDAAPRAVKEQAAWLIDVALSLLRLLHEDFTVCFPLISDEEAHPLVASEAQDMALVFDGRSLGWLPTRMCWPASPPSKPD